MSVAALIILACAGAGAGWASRAVIRSYTRRPAELVPVPAPAGRGLTRHRAAWMCGVPPDPAPGAVEAAGAMAFTAAGVWSAGGPVLPAACWLAGLAVPLAFIDGVTRRLPDRLTGPALAGTLLLLVAAAAGSGQWQDLARALAGGAVMGGWYVLLSIAGVAGGGDGKLAPSLGAVLAWAGWQPVVTALLGAYVLAAPFSIGVLLAGRSARGRRIPFAPFMIAAVFVVMAAPGTRA